MTRSFLQVSWRLLLTLSLVVGPWPPAAWAAVAPERAESTAAGTDCHGAAETAPLQAIDASCDDGCCPDPTCDPAHCVLVHASMATTSPPRMAAVPPAAAPGIRHDRVSTGPPILTLLRPPIA